MMVWLLWLYLILLFNSVLYSSASSSSSSFLSSPSPLCHPDESSALLQFNNSFSIDHENCLLYNNVFYYGVTNPCMTLSWENGTDCCTWSGITCDKTTGYVIGLDLRFGGLVGLFQSNSSLFLLHHLQSLILSRNDFGGSQVSSQFGRFANLTHLDLSYSFFSGQVPPEISYLSKLVTLDLSGNPELRLETHALKKFIKNVTNIRDLVLTDVNMSSILPISFMNLSSSLTSLDIKHSALHGEFPECIFRLPNLQELYLDGNINLHGSFPKYNWSSPIRKLFLSETKFLIDLPHLTTSLKFLDTLHLRRCHFRGSYPTLLKNLTKITSLDLSSNNFGGQIPWSSFNLEKITNLDLSDNFFTGQIPEICNNLTQAVSSCTSSRDQLVGPLPLYLKTLWLSDNLLNGTLPSWLYSLPSLQELVLSKNHFTGQIKEFRSRSLVLLLIDRNRLYGRFPRSIFQQLNLRALDLSLNNFNGIVWFDQFSDLKRLQYLDLSFNSLSFKANNFINYTVPKDLIFLALSSCNITTFPYSLRSLENLEELNLSHNQIGLNESLCLWNMSKDSSYSLNLLRDVLTNTDQIPWKNLQNLNLSFNQIQGQLPIPPPSTIIFSISNNQLTGDVPSSICSMSSSFQVLDLSNNNLSGNIPPCIGNFSGSLSVLDLRNNSFHGMIPSTFVKGNSLRSLILNGNCLEGSLPRSLLNCEKLETINLGSNKINDTFPGWLGSLPMLEILILRSNRFHGSIGYHKGSLAFQKLRIVDLSNNKFSGPLPAQYFESLLAMMDSDHGDGLTYIGEQYNLTYINQYYYYDSTEVAMKGVDRVLWKIQNFLRVIDFSRNNFQGEIPHGIGKLKSLIGLNFSHNRLTGLIPPSLGNLSNLEWLDLSSNELNGEIPLQLVDLTFLQGLNLSQNQLVGPIPRGRQFNTFENDSYSGNPGLCGFPLSKSCSNDAHKISPATFQQEEQRNEFDIWKMVLMGYGCGLVIGISMGYLMLPDEPIEWLAKRIRGESRHKLVRISKHNARLNGGIRRRS